LFETLKKPEDIGSKICYVLKLCEIRGSYSRGYGDCTVFCDVMPHRSYEYFKEPAESIFRGEYEGSRLL
jgi:hypothetical protein